MELHRTVLSLHMVFIFFSHKEVMGLQEYFITDKCLTNIGPTQGDVISYHPDAKGQWMVPTTNLDCWMILVGMATKQGDPQRWISLGFRRYKMNGYDKINSTSNDTCETAYMEVFHAHADGRLIDPSAPLLRRCGNSLPSVIESNAEAFAIHLFVEAPTWATPSAQIQSFFRKGSSSTKKNGKLISPKVDFKADFTSYFIGNCSGDGVDNDVSQWQCTNERCVHIELLCDVLGSINCRDSTDEKVGPPSNCSVVTTVPPPIEQQLLPLWPVVGGLPLLAMLYWCLWRPGYIPWRLARLRNATCCGKVLSSPCKKISCCKNNGLCGPRDGCFLKCCSSCVGTGSGGPSSGVKPKGGTGEITQGGGCCDSMRRRGGGYGGGGGSGGIGDGGGRRRDKVGGAKEGWMNFAYDDGGHVREVR